MVANGHTRGTVHVRTYVQTQYDEKRHEKRIGTILPPNGGQILSTVLADKEIAYHGTHTGVFHDWLEGLPPNISFHPGYYCTANALSNVNSRETMSKVYFPPIAALISRVTCKLGLHAPRFTLYQPFP